MGKVTSKHFRCFYSSVPSLSCHDSFTSARGYTSSNKGKGGREFFSKWISERRCYCHLTSGVRNTTPEKGKRADCLITFFARRIVTILMNFQRNKKALFLIVSFILLIIRLTYRQRNWLCSLDFLIAREGFFIISLITFDFY